jgi:hypothetical protein
MWRRIVGFSGWQLTLLVAAIAGCGAARADSADSAAVHTYASSKGTIVIDLNTRRVSVFGRAMTLRDCSDAKYWCFESETGGPSLSVAKRCADRHPVEAHAGYQTESLALVHPGWTIVKDSRSPDYAFLVSAGYGVREIYYDADNSGVIRAARIGHRMDMEALAKLALKKTDEVTFFSCR